MPGSPSGTSTTSITTRYPLEPVERKTLIQGAIQGMVEAVGDPYSSYLSPEDFTGSLDDISGRSRASAPRSGRWMPGNATGLRAVRARLPPGRHRADRGLARRGGRASSRATSSSRSTGRARRADARRGARSRPGQGRHRGHAPHPPLRRAAESRHRRAAGRHGRPARHPTPHLAVPRAAPPRAANGPRGLRGHASSGPRSSAARSRPASWPAARSATSAWRASSSAGATSSRARSRPARQGHQEDRPRPARQPRRLRDRRATSRASSSPNGPSSGTRMRTASRPRPTRIVAAWRRTRRSRSSSSSTAAPPRPPRSSPALPRTAAARRSIGETTFGKGTVQEWIELGEVGGVKLTVWKWLTPDKRWIHKVGLITPGRRRDGPGRTCRRTTTRSSTGRSRCSASRRRPHRTCCSRRRDHRVRLARRTEFR